MNSRDSNGLNAFVSEESLADSIDGEIRPTDDKTISTSAAEEETDDDSDASISVPVPEIAEGNLKSDPRLDHPSFEELVDAEQISSYEMAHLKAKYDSLKNLLQSGIEKEERQETIVDSYYKENQRLQEELRRFNTDSDDNKEAVSRKNLLAARNSVAISEYNTSQIELQIERMKEKKEALDVEYTAMCQAQEDMLQMQDLKEACTELRKEVVQKRADVELLTDVLQESSGSVLANANMLRELKGQEKQLALEELAISSVPRDLAKQSERLLRYQGDELKLLAQADAQLNEVNSNAAKDEEKLNALDLEKRHIHDAVSDLKDEAFAWEKKIADLTRNYEEARFEDILLAETKADLLMNLQHAKVDRRAIRQMNSRIASEIDQNVKQVRLGEKHINVIQEICRSLMDLLLKINRQITSIPDGNTFAEKKRTLQAEIQDKFNALSKQGNQSKGTQMLYDESVIRIQKLESELDTECRQLREHVRKTTSLNHSIEREAIKIRDAVLKGKRLKGTVASKKSQVEDLKKILQYTHQKVANVKALTDVIKDKGIQIWRLDETARYKIYEMTERIGLLTAEAKIRAEKAALITERLESEQIKVILETEEYHRLRHRIIDERLNVLRLADRSRSMELAIDGHSRKVDQMARDLLEVNRCFRSAVIARNKRGIELAERNEEMSFLLDRINVQTKVIDEAELALRRKVDEISLLQVELLDERRLLELVHGSIPERDWNVREIYKLTEQICETRERLVELEEEYINTESGTRVRFLKGTDAEPKQMKMKHEHMEIRFSKKECQVKEKKLVLRRIDQLIDCTKKKLNSGKEEAMHVASHVNHLQRNLKRVTRQMMASVAELSIYRAQTFSMTQTIGDQRRALQDMPTFSHDEEEDNADNTDNAVDRQRSSPEVYDRAEQIMHAEAIFINRYQSASNELPASNQRPNAYLSDPLELSLPRPYDGPCGPFMPTKPAPAMRYFRKPNRSDSEC